MRARSKVWLASGGAQVFGEGKAAILRAIADAGSINGAARELGMSFRHVWSAITAAERRLGRKLLKRSRGGTKGGGAELTAFAEDLLEKFDELDDAVRGYADKCCARIFGKGRREEWNGGMME